MATEQTTAWQVLDSIGTLTDKYEGFILDQFGVMHNGVCALEGASECVQALAAAGKKLVILSNTSSSSTSALSRLPKLGFDPALFVGAVTSGEEASRHIQNTYRSNEKALFFTWKLPKTPSPAEFVEKCGNISLTDEVDQADFMLLHGSEVLRGPGPDGEASEIGLADFFATEDFSVLDPILKQCAARKLVAVCANPDFIYVKPNGGIGHMPGKIARRYEELGGTVISFGKPYKEHFEACVSLLGLPKDKIVHVGDSLHHDVAGANASGIDSIFVSSGVHCKEMEGQFGQAPPTDKLDALFALHKETPTYVVPLLRM